MNKSNTKTRLIFLACLVLVVVSFAGIKLMQIQIVDGKKYLEKSNSSTTSTVKINAARGEMLDRYNRPIVKNKVGFNIVFDRIFLPKGKENATISKLITILQSQNEPWLDELPISTAEPYAFLPEKDREITRLRKDVELPETATADQCIQTLEKLFKTEEFTDKELKRRVLGVRYSMVTKGFSSSNRYVFAADVSNETIIKIKELNFLFPGVDIAEDTIREYLSKDLMPAIIGYLSPIFPEEFEELELKGYELNDIKGRAGLEFSFEDTLRGKDGTRTVVQNNRYEVVSTEITNPTVPGNTIVLSVDMLLQQKVQEILESHIKWLKSGGNPKIDKTKVKGGSVVVMDTKTGGVLSSASYPTYDINERKEKYAEWIKDPLQPTFNRTLLGVYRPGSTYKTAVAIAGLSEGLITPSSTVFCGRVYDYYGKVDAPTCLGTHGNINVTNALKVSCNIFFYDVGRRLGIDTINKYSAQLGLGVETGLEIANEVGVLANPQYRKSQGGIWYKGDVLQAAIGQSDNMVTPLQMAIEAMTLANKGVRYKAHLVDAVMDYNNETVVAKTTPSILSNIQGQEQAFNTVKEGMVLAASRVGGSNSLSNLGARVAIKTGTPQISLKKFNSAAIAYYPADDPKIAISVIIEEGENASYLIRKVIEAYEFSLKNTEKPIVFN